MATWHSKAGKRNRKPPTNPKKGYPKYQRYPWDKWFGYRRLVLLRGKDYKCSTYVMAQQIRNAAGKAKYKVKVQIDVLRDEVGLVLNVLSHHGGVPGPLPITPTKPNREDD